MIKNFLSSIVVSLFLILLVILCSENDKEESRHEPQNTWFYMPTQKEVEYEGYFIHIAIGIFGRISVCI